MSNEKKLTTKKRSTVRHTRAIQVAKTKQVPAAPPDAEVEKWLTEMVHPATLRQLDHYHKLGLRERLLTLPVTVAFVLSLIWRQMGSVRNLVRVLGTEGLLWMTEPMPVSQQAVCERLRTLPAELFERILADVLVQMEARWQKRERPLPPEIAWAQKRYTDVLVHDGSTLDALLRKVGLLQESETNPLAGRMTALLSLVSRLPRRVWYEADAQAHDQRFWPQILAALPAGALLIFDLGYTNFQMFLELSAAQVTFLTRAKSNLRHQVEQVLFLSAQVRDQIVWIGKEDERQRVRLVEVLHQGKWYRYLTSELDADRLPTAYVFALYHQRWRIEDAYAIVKRLLGLAYFWTGAENGIQLQLWATWLLYALLVDLTDAVAQALNQPFAAISIEMVYRSLYYFTQAYHRGIASDPIAYLAENQKLFGIRKYKFKRTYLIKLDLTSAPSP
jgi:hypothetical protein